MKTYQLIDSGKGEKLERFGQVSLTRPCAQALWQPKQPEKVWVGADARFSREGDEGWKGKLPDCWEVEIEGLLFKVAPTPFGHVGVFPEHALVWRQIDQAVKQRGRASVLNLFAYSGGATLAAARAGAEVCHVDSSAGMVDWARENAALNGLEKAPIRWIVDDVFKFLQREERRGRRYDGILLDPPSFGRGKRGEVFKIEEDLGALLKLCARLLSQNPLFLILSSHTQGHTPTVLRHLVEEAINREAKSGELLLPGERDIPSGAYAIWTH